MSDQSSYQDLKDQINKLRCSHCHGLGYKDDAEPGDISYNQWCCNSCKGTGFEHGFDYQLQEVVK